MRYSVGWALRLAAPPLDHMHARRERPRPASPRNGNPRGMLSSAIGLSRSP
jgi:hypothetical protein